MNKLSHDQFKATIAKPLQLNEGQPPFDFWQYVEEIPKEDFENYDCSAGNIHNVYKMKGNYYEHVLIASKNENVVMALVLDTEKNEVFGHCLLKFDEMNNQ